MIPIKKFIKLSTKILIILFVGVVLSIGGLYLYSYISPKIAIKTNGKFYIYDNKSDLVYQGSSSSEWVNIEDISENFKTAVISVEDKIFINIKALITLE